MAYHSDNSNGQVVETSTLLPTSPDDRDNGSAKFSGLEYRSKPSSSGYSTLDRGLRSLGGQHLIDSWVDPRTKLEHRTKHRMKRTLIMVPCIFCLAILLHVVYHWAIHISPWNVQCDEYDDDDKFSELSCLAGDSGFCDVRYDGGGLVSCIDNKKACYRGNKNGTAMHTWCGTACNEHWGAYCVWEAWAHAKELCAGTFSPTTPSRRLASGKACAFHARCESCGSGGKCNKIYHAYYFSRIFFDFDYSANEQAAAALEPPVLKEWCEKWDYPYTEVTDVGR
eukprot:CAMPEP_0119474222 /NCGR_PEP_ID=MMETSP1344-20130328/5560_1 /TAXON_ID=236787 /ORGANISM="Florenciella parvula, Strain CCMP2471" /LENGTH=280 /DNA_ID=CAMNT_0007507471 /DNA_START=108 /DNA_END=950 /DNA_ORIENTATION=-